MCELLSICEYRHKKFGNQPFTPPGLVTKFPDDLFLISSLHGTINELYSLLTVLYSLET